ncbi:expressed protein, partial [Aureococcus anophagefferens]
ACTGLVTSYLTLDGALGDESRADRREMANHASREVYGTLMSIMSSGVDSAPDEAGDALAQRFVKGFFGFFVLVATTLYTANLAAMLSDDAAYDLEIDSIAACEAARCSVCVHSQTWAYAAEIFAASPLRRVEGGWTAAANYARLTAGDCDAIMLSYSDYVTLDVNEAQNLDAYQFVGRPAFSYPEALAVADLYQKPVSHYVRQIIEESLYDAYWDKHAGALAADPWAASEAPDSTRESMGVAEMLGPIALSLASLVVALAVHFLRKKERQLERFYSNRSLDGALKDLEDAERRVRRFSGARPAVAVGAETKAEGAHLDPGAARPPSPTRRRTSAAVVDVHLERMTSPMPVRVSVDPPEEEDASAWMCPGRPLMHRLLLLLPALATTIAEPDWAQRAAAVKDAIHASFGAYMAHASDFDVLLPAAKTGGDVAGARYALYESLDTLYVAGLADDFDAAVAAIFAGGLRDPLRRGAPAPKRVASVAEYARRVVGGLLGGFEVSGDRRLLYAAAHAAERALDALPDTQDVVVLPPDRSRLVHARTASVRYLLSHWVDDGADCETVGNAGGFGLELRALSRELDDPSFASAADAIFDEIDTAWFQDGAKDSARRLPRYPA